MLRKYLISGLVGMTVFSACKTANTASNAKTEDGSAPSTDDLKSKIEQAYHDTYQMREQTLKQIDLDREMIKDLKLDRDGASRIAKISTAVAATGVLAAGGAAASMVGFSAFLTMGAAPTFFSSAQVLLGTVAFEAAVDKRLKRIERALFTGRPFIRQSTRPIGLGGK